MEEGGGGKGTKCSKLFYYYCGIVYDRMEKRMYLGAGRYNTILYCIVQYIQWIGAAWTVVTRQANKLS